MSTVPDSSRVGHSRQCGNTTALTWHANCVVVHWQTDERAGFCGPVEVRSSLSYAAQRSALEWLLVITMVDWRFNHLLSTGLVPGANSKTCTVRSRWTFSTRGRGLEFEARDERALQASLVASRSIHIPSP
jgi:hypothetical protein